MNLCPKCKGRVYLGVGHDALECLEKQWKALIRRCHNVERKLKEWERWAEVNELQGGPRP